MSEERALDVIPFGAFFAGACVATLLAIELGLWLGARRRAAHEPDGPVGSVVAAVLGLLAFMLAFTFGVTATRYDARKALLLDDVNAIGTAYLRAGLLPQPHRAQTQQLLRAYVDVRAEMATVKNPDAIRDVVARSETLQDQLWAQAVALAEADRNSETYAMFTTALNDVFDLHTKRVVHAMQYRVPMTVWLVLFFVSMLAMGLVGFQFGLAGKRSVFASLALALTFSAVLVLIQEMDQTRRGWMTVSQQPMLDLQQKLRAER